MPVRWTKFLLCAVATPQLGGQVRIRGIEDERCSATIFLRHTVRAIDKETASLCRGFLRYSDIAIIVSRDRGYR